MPIGHILDRNGVIHAIHFTAVRGAYVRRCDADTSFSRKAESGELPPSVPTVVEDLIFAPVSCLACLSLGGNRE